MSRKRPDAAAELAGRMLQVLESRRTFGGEADPPTLQHLGELCDGTPSHDLIVKAATKKVFTDQAVVLEKDGKTPRLDSPVYFKDDVPKPDERLARRMLAVLESQRHLGGYAYPPTLRRLAELCDFKGPEKVIRKAATLAPMADRATALARSGKAIVVDGPVALNEDIDGGFEAVLPGLLRFALGPVATGSKVKKETAAFTPKELARRLPVLGCRLEDAVREGVERLSLPPGIAWVPLKGEPLLFLAENLRPRSGAPAPADPVPDVPESPAPGDSFAPGDFPRAFRAAFEVLDRRNGSTNFVKLSQLREALADFSREEFDDGLRQLRIDGVFSLDSHEGLHGSLTDEEREAGVREAGSLLVYASRR